MDLHKQTAPKSAALVETYIRNNGVKTFDVLINLLICHIEIYMQNEGKESESPVNTIINLHTSAGLTIFMKIVHNVIKATQATGEPKAEIYELRKQIAKILQNNAEHILSDEFYKFEDFIK